jgi:hypothetical protein
MCDETLGCINNSHNRPCDNRLCGLSTTTQDHIGDILGNPSRRYCNRGMRSGFTGDAFATMNRIAEPLLA